MKTTAARGLAALTLLSGLAWAVLALVGLSIGSTAYPSPEDLASAASASGTATSFLLVAVVSGVGLLVVAAVDQQLRAYAAGLGAGRTAEALAGDAAPNDPGTARHG